MPWRAAAVWLRWWRCSAAAGERSSGLARWDRARLRRFTHWAVAVPGAVAPERAPRLQGFARGLGGGACVGGSHGSGRPVLTPRPGQDGAESLSMFLCKRVRSEMGVDSVGVGGGEPGGPAGGVLRLVVTCPSTSPPVGPGCSAGFGPQAVPPEPPRGRAGSSPRAGPGRARAPRRQPDRTAPSSSGRFPGAGMTPHPSTDSNPPPHPGRSSSAPRPAPMGGRRRAGAHPA